MQAILIIITSEILIVKKPCLSKYLLSDIRFETFDSKLAQKYFVCYFFPVAETHCILDIFILSLLVKTQLFGRGLYFSYQNLRDTVLRSLQYNGLLRVCRCTERSISVGLISLPDGESNANLRNSSFRQNWEMTKSVSNNGHLYNIGYISINLRTYTCY